MNERALEAWVGKYVSVVEAPLDGRRPLLTGSIEAVGADGFIVQPKDTPRQSQDLPPKRFLPWRTVHHVVLPRD